MNIIVPFLKLYICIQHHKNYSLSIVNLHVILFSVGEDGVKPLSPILEDKKIVVQLLYHYVEDLMMR